MKNSILKARGSGDPPLTTQQRQEWNNYVDWLEKTGHKGSPLLDKKDTGLAHGLFNQFKKENPSTTLSLDHIKSVQTEMGRLADAVRNFEVRRSNPNAQNIMTGTSKVDGWPGSKTTSFKFPGMAEKQFVDGELTSYKNLGILDPRLRPADSLSKSTPNIATAPTGVKVEKMADGRYYYQNRDGDWRPYNR